MRAAEIILRFKAFSEALEEHSKLWGNSLDSSGFADGAVHNREELFQQERELHKMLAVLTPFISQFTMVREIGAHGQAWDIFLSSVSDDLPLRKGRSLATAIQQIDGIIARLELEDPNHDFPHRRRIASTVRRIFVSHGNQSRALDRVERFIRALGLAPIIVKHEPSLGGAVDDVVELQMESCEAAIVLATKDEQVEQRWQPRPNVLHEIGVSQQRLANRVVYLKEVGCEFPSNVAPKIWENFSQDNMEDAFIKIAKELHGFGVL
jgi:predicted nucleotide-binding protein